MCTYLTEKIDVEGSGKGAQGWFGLRSAAVYVDHPHHARHDHTLNIDFLNPELGASARVAVELTEEAARELADAIHRALATAPPGLASAHQSGGHQVGSHRPGGHQAGGHRATEATA